MAVPIMSGGFQDQYHDGMLIFRTRPVAPSAARMGIAVEPQYMPEPSPGMAALAQLESAGQIKRMVSVAPSTLGSAMMGMDAAMAPFAAEERSVEEDPAAGVNIVELERDRDVRSLHKALADDPNVEEVSRVPVRYLVGRAAPGAGAAAAPIGILAAAPPISALWNLSKIGWSEAYTLPDLNDASDVRVAVLDTGIDENHPDLQDQIVCYVSDHPDLPGVSSRQDLVGHGTHVAGTIAALVNNDVGIQGICQAQLWIWKIFDDQPDYIRDMNEFAYLVDPIMYRRALRDCYREGIDVINLSIGGPGKPDFLESMLFRTLLEKGTIVVAAMGNERRYGSPTSYPAAIPGVVAVGATSINDKVADFSNAGNHITLCAPGVGIWSTLPTYPGQFGFTNDGTKRKPQIGKPIRRDTDYDSWNGTSMASPHVAAAVALLLANRGKMSGEDVRRSLVSSADPVPWMAVEGHDPDYGAGRLNLVRLLA